LAPFHFLFTISRKHWRAGCAHRDQTYTGVMNLTEVCAMSDSAKHSFNVRNQGT
jgi:hypothetical protein